MTEKAAVNTPSYQDLEKGFVYAIQDEYALEHADKERLLNLFLSWLETAGWPLAEKVLTDTGFTDAELPYRWLAVAVCVWRADKAIYRDDQGDCLGDYDAQFCQWGRVMVARGENLMRAGYFGNSFTDEDIECLRAYRLYCECRILHIPAWPYDLDIHEHGTIYGYHPLGERIPDIHLPTFAMGLAELGYTDAPPADYFQIIKPAALDEFFTLFAAYEPRVDENGRKYVVAKPWLKTEGMVSLSDDIGKRPIVLIVAAAMDCFWARASALAEHLYQSYGESVAFYWVNIDVSDFLIRGDTTVNYYKQWAGLEIPGHESSIADRARTSKKLYMTHPEISYPCLLDDPADTVASYFQENGGSGGTVMIDLEGRVAVHTTHNWEHWMANCPPQRGCCEQFAWADEIERELRAFLQHGGHFDPAHPSFYRHDNLHKDHVAGEPKVMYLIASRIIDIDLEKGVMNIIGRPSTFSVIGRGPEDREFFNDPHPMVIHFDAETCVTCQNTPVPMSDLKPGDIIQGPGYIQVSEGTWRATTIHLQGGAQTTKQKEGPLVGDAYLYGNVVSVDAETKHLVMGLPLHTADMIGYQCIQAEQDVLELSGTALTNYTALGQWIESKVQQVQVTVRDDSWLSRNGELCRLADMQAGDRLCVWYQTQEAGQTTITAALIRASSAFTVQPIAK